MGDSIKTVSSLKVAVFLINSQKIDSGLRDISHLKLQKLLYYCQAFHLAMKGCPLFEEEVIAWPYGPVVLEVYHQYKGFGSSILSPSESDEDEPILEGAEEKSYHVISAVLEAYGRVSAMGLVEKTHNEKPWQEAFEKGKGTVISKEAMKDYYKTFLTDD